MENTQKKERRSAIRIMGSLIGLVRPLCHIMILAILLGVAGYLCAISLTILAGHALLLGVTQAENEAGLLFFHGDGMGNASVGLLLGLMVLFAVLRGFLHYAEQYCNHFIAFRLLAIIRHQVFAALRKLCPAKLEGRDRGNLISMITTDIELLEVFYAHTISPIAIACLTSLIMVLWIGHFHMAAGLLALAAYGTVGVMIPLAIGYKGGKRGLEFRNQFGELSSFVLESLRGLDETIAYGRGEQRKQEMEKRSVELGELQKGLSHLEEIQRSVTNLAILVYSFGMLFLSLYLYREGAMGLGDGILATISMMASFGPVVALSNLSNNLNQTLASGERVLSILEEQPAVEEVPASIPDRAAARADADFSGAGLEQVTFSYEQEKILQDYSLDIRPGKILGIHGASGCGKSTILKLLMRFWDVNQGAVQVSGENVKTIPTVKLRGMEGFVTQETQLFHDSISNNIAVGRQGASREEIVEAAKKASIHDWIAGLPQGYDTMVGELGDTLSGGEKQRIGIARAFLHDAPFLLLDEPTSNLDSLNEGIILKSLKESAEKKTVVLVSHRESTLRVADKIIHMEK